jgi:hypothetical protein
VEIVRRSGYGLPKVATSRKLGNLKEGLARLFGHILRTGRIVWESTPDVPQFGLTYP